MKRAWLAGAGVVALIGLPVTFKVIRSGEAKAVEAQAVEPRLLSPTIFASGTLTYEKEVRLVPEVIGRVTELLVQEGDQVARGQLLLKLDASVTRAELAQLAASRPQAELGIERQKVDLETSAAKWRRYERLRAQGIVDASTFEEIDAQRQAAQVELATRRAMLEQTQAQIAQARERLAKTEVRAPLAGKVTAIFIKVGETAIPSAISIAGADLMVIADTRSVYAEVNVDETDIARVGVGQEARIVPAAFPDESWKGGVMRMSVAPRQNAGQSRSYPVRIRLADAQMARFRPGMSCRAEVSTRRTDAKRVLAVPVQAVRYEEPVNRGETTKASLFVISAGRAVERPVETGTADDAYIEITRGLKEREMVVTGPSKVLRFLRAGDPVRAVKPEEALVWAR